MIAIIGGGISGLAAARAIAPAHPVELFEAAPEIGGHTSTVTVDTGGERIGVDTGFIIYNERTYPRFTRMLADLKVATRETDMSFSVSCDRCALEYGSSGLDAIFAQRRNLVRPAHWRMLAGVLTFFRAARRDFAGARGALDLSALTLEDWADRRGIHRGALLHFLLPMGAAIWSASPSRMLAFPAASILAFLANHGLLGLTTAPRWRTVVGGSHTYVRALLAQLPARVHRATEILRVRRDSDGVTLDLATGASRRFDAAVLAVHADTALALLAEPTAEERRILGAFRFSRNETYLHTDTSFLPRRRAAWSSWNTRTADCLSPGEGVEASYWMNRLQGLTAKPQYIVSLNPARALEPERVLWRGTYAHPIFDFAAVQAQAEIGSLQGKRRTWFCGAWQGYGFHEDGVRSGEQVAAAILPALLGQPARRTVEDVQ